MFNSAVDKFYPLFEEGKVYLISRGTLKQAKRQFSAGIKNDLEITLNENSIVQLVEDDASIAQLHFNFKPLGSLKDIPNNEVVDVIGIVESISELKEFTSQKTGKEFKKRSINIVDHSNHEKVCVEITLWNKDAEREDINVNDVLAVKSCRRSDFSGVSLSAIPVTKIIINPEIPQAKELRKWYETSGKTAHRQSLTVKANFTPKFTLAQVDNFRGREEIVKVKATVTFIKSEGLMWYEACSNESCKGKKMIRQDVDGETRWMCPSCNGEFYECDYRYSFKESIYQI